MGEAVGGLEEGLAVADEGDVERVVDVVEVEERRRKGMEGRR